jgi:hypothetical protein
MPTANGKKSSKRFLANLGRLDDPNTALNVDRLMEKLKAFAFKQQVIDMGKDLQNPLTDLALMNSQVRHQRCKGFLF